MFVFVFDLLIYVVGIVLILLSFFPIKNGVVLDIYVIGYLGILLFLWGIVHGLFFLNRKVDASFQYISSKFLPLTKFYLPLSVLILLLFTFILIYFDLYSGNNVAIFITLCFMLLGWLLLLIPEMYSKTICIRGNTLLVTNYFKSIHVQLHEIQEIKRLFYLTFVIKTSNSNYSRILFRPIFRIVGPLSLFVFPDSVKEFRRIVEKSKVSKK